MTDREKVLLVGVAIVALFLFWFSHRSGDQKTIEEAAADNTGVIPNVAYNFTPGDLYVPTIPDYAGGAQPISFNMGGTCCMDCATPSMTSYGPQGGGLNIEFVNVQGNRGANIYNMAPPPPPPSAGVTFYGPGHVPFI